VYGCGTVYAAALFPTQQLMKFMKHPYYSGGGGSGGTGGGGGGGGGGGADACLSVFLHKPLSSPNPAVLATLTVGTDLLVLAKGSALEIQTKGGAVCGTIISDAADVIACINHGHKYIALIMSLSGGKCTVEIRHQ